MNTLDEERNPVEVLAEEFAERRRRGEHPTLREYCERHPELAEEIRDLFPALVMIEDLDGSSGVTTGSTGGAEPTSPSPRVEQLGDYRILREIGRGGMGVVYQAEQESLGRRVALKVLASQAVSDPRQVRRFEREARAAARLNHTNIVPVFGVGNQDGRHYYVMQYISGLGLDLVIEEVKRLRPGPATVAGPRPAQPDPAVREAAPGVTAAEVARSLVTGQFGLREGAEDAGTTAPASDMGNASVAVTRDPSAEPSDGAASELSGLSESHRTFYKSVARIGMQAAEALEYANSQGVLHRDVKPSNLLLDHKGNVWVADFGLAKTAEADDLTHTGDILGTIRYMAPERFRGQCDVRSDVYSLGLTLYELIALRPAYQASDRNSLIERVLNEDPPALRKLAPAVPRDLETIVHKAVARDPAQRYATAGALGEDLRRFLEDRPIRARRVSMTEHLARWARRNKGLAAALTTVGLLLVAIAIGSTIAAVWYQEAATREARLHQAARKQSEDLRRKDYVYRLALADREIDASNMSAAADLLEGCPEELRDSFEYRYVRRRAHLDLPRFHGVQADVVSLDYSPDGKWLFAAEGDMYAPKASDYSVLVKRDAETGEIAGRLSVPGGIRSIDVSPDGIWVAIGVGYYDYFGPPFPSKGEVILADSRTLKIQWHHRAPGPWWANAVVFSPDNSKILVGYGWTDSPTRKKSGTAEVLARASGSVLRSFPGLGPEEIGYGDVAFHPDGRTVTLGSYERIALYNLDSREPIGVISTMQRGCLYALAFSPDGSQVASAGWGRTIHLWDTKTRKLLRRLDGGHLGFVRDLAFSPNGRFLASASEDRSVRLWNVETGDLDAVFHGHALHALSVAWHPYGRLLASGGTDNAIKLWDVRASRPVIKWHFGWPNGIAFEPSSDHGVLATQGHYEAFNHQIRLWNPTTGESIDEPDSWDPASVTSIAGAVRARGLEMPTENVLAAAAWSRDGKYLAWLDGLHTIRVREGAKGKVVRSLEDEAEAVYVLVFTPDGSYLISAGQPTDSKGLKGTMACWDVKAGRVKWRRALGDLWAAVAMSPDGRQLAVTDGSAGQLVLLDVSSGEFIATLARDPELAFTCCAFDPGGTRLAVGCSDPKDEFGHVKVLDLVTGRELLRLTGHTARVTSVAFSPDGRRLASGSFDRTIKLWDTTHGDEVLTLSGHTQGVLRVAFSPDGNLLATGGIDFTVRIWDARPLHEPGGP